MPVVEENRQCPICEQMVQNNITGVKVFVSPARSVILHQGCAERTYYAWLSFLASISDEAVMQEVDVEDIVDESTEDDS